MKKIRMFKTLPTPRGTFESGKSYPVGNLLGQVRLIWAESWVKTGHAEEDKAIDGAPETKAKKVKKEK